MDVDQPPPAKKPKLRCGDEDLKITLGGGQAVVAAGDDAREKSEENRSVAELDVEKAVYWYYSSIMASHSKYVDAMLAAPGRERDPFELSFPETEPSEWELMIKFLESPVEARAMTRADAVAVAKWYDKYDFEAGRLLCDQVLADHFQEMGKYKRYAISLDVDAFVDDLLLVDSCNLPKARTAGLKYLDKRMNHRDSQTLGRIMFEVRHIEKLVPLFAKRFSEPPVPSYLRGYSADDAVNPLFPRLFVEQSISKVSRKELYRSCTPLKVLDLDGSCDDFLFTKKGLSGKFLKFACKNTFWLDDESTIGSRLTIERRSGDDPLVKSCGARAAGGGWCIVGTVGPREGEGQIKILWLAPKSYNYPLPPESLWKPVHELVTGKPHIKYKYK